MNVLLNNRWEDFIRKQLEIGRYQNASELIRVALRLLEEKEMEFGLKKALTDGVESGKSENWNKERFLEKANKRADQLGLP